MQPLNALPKYNLFGLEEQDYNKAKVVVMPVPYDSTLTYRAGARNGPKAIIDASRNLELYSYELGKDISEVGIYTTDELAPDMSSPENMVSEISKEVGIVLDYGKIPMLLGGEHTITIGAIKAFKERNRSISIVQLDAHSDSRDELFGSKYMHATVTAREKEMYDVVLVGIRSIDKDSFQSIDRSRTFFIDDVHTMGAEELAESISDMTGKDIYLSIDIDVMDPAEMPSVGTPEPDGMRFAEIKEMLEHLSKMKNLAGIDIVELSPIPGLEAPNYLAAKLAYLSLGYFLSQ